MSAWTTLAVRVGPVPCLISSREFTQMAAEKKATLLERLDEAAKDLLAEMGNNTMEIGEDGSAKLPLAATERVAIFNSVVRYLAVKHRVQPEEEDTGLDDFIQQLHGKPAPRREVEPRARKTEPVATPQAQVQHTAAMLAAFRAISMILAVRLLLLLSIAGAFYLAVMAMDRLSNDSLLVLCAYCLLTVVPLVCLDIKGKRPGG